MIRERLSNPYFQLGFYTFLAGMASMSLILLTFKVFR